MDAQTVNTSRTETLMRVRTPKRRKMSTFYPLAVLSKYDAGGGGSLRTWSLAPRRPGGAAMRGGGGSRQESSSLRMARIRARSRFALASNQGTTNGIMQMPATNSDTNIPTGLVAMPGASASSTAAAAK